jgi:hypothetical protein
MLELHKMKTRRDIEITVNIEIPHVSMTELN